MIKQLKNTKQAEYHANPIIKKIKLCAKSMKNSYRFSIALVANNIGVHPFQFVSKMKELAKRLQFTFMTVDYGVFFKEITYVPSNIIEKFEVETVTDKLMEEFEKQRMSQCEKLDAFYSLMKKYAKKSINDFREQDVYNNHASDLEEYIRTYFREGAYAMKQLLISRGFKREPVLVLKKDDDSCHELKETIENFLEKNQKYTRDEITEKTAIGPIYVDFVKLLLGVVNDTFALGEWKDTEYWGAYEHYDLGEALPLIYKYFEDFVESQKDKGYNLLKKNHKKDYKKLLIGQESKMQNLQEAEDKMILEEAEDDFVEAPVEAPVDVPKDTKVQSDEEDWENEVEDADMKEYYKEMNNKGQGL